MKNIPAELYKRIKITALENRRSINNEIIKRLENSLMSKKIDADRVLAELDDFYKDKNIPPLTPEMIKQAKEEGRE